MKIDEIEQSNIVNVEAESVEHALKLIKAPKGSTGKATSIRARAKLTVFEITLAA